MKFHVKQSAKNGFRSYTKKLEKVLIFNRSLYKKIALMHRKGEFLKLREAFVTF